MNHFEFIQYHNYHIQFCMSDGTLLSGVVANTINMHENKPSTIYCYIPSRNMAEWKEAERKNDSVKMKSLESEIDIQNISWAERLN